jgi:hypothetical protein
MKTNTVPNEPHHHLTLPFPTYRVLPRHKVTHNQAYPKSTGILTIESFLFVLSMKLNCEHVVSGDVHSGLDLHDKLLQACPSAGE